MMVKGGDSAAEFDAALAEVLAQFGRRVVDRPDQLRGALSDTLGASAGEHRSEVDAVVAASRTGVAGEIRDADPAVAASPEQIRGWLDQIVSAGVSLRDAALATRSWAEVFDASETARVTSEVSSELLGQGAPSGRPTAPYGAIVTDPITDVGAPRTPAPTGHDERTDLGDDSLLGTDPDHTRLPADTATPDESPIPPASQTLSSIEGSAAATTTEIRRWRPVLIACGALVAAAAVGIPWAIASSRSAADTNQSPLGKYQAAMFGYSLEREARKGVVVELDDAWSDCMADAGFNYEPDVGNQLYWEWDIDDRDDVARFGYGVVNHPGVDIADPNEQYIAALSDERRAAYDEAFTGCISKGNDVVIKDLSSMDEFAALKRIMSILAAEIRRDPEITALEARWVACMKLEGHSGFELQADAQQSILDDYGDIRDSLTDPEWDDPALQALARREVALALDDLKCREQVDYRATELRVRSSYEARFIEENRAELDRLLAVAEQND